MANFLNKIVKEEAGNKHSLPSIPLTKVEAEVLLSAIKQSTFKGEHARQVVALIDKFEKHISQFD